MKISVSGWADEKDVRREGLTVERENVPLDLAEDYSAELFGHDLKEFDLEY